MGDRTPETILLWFFLALFLVSMVLLGWLLWPFFSIIVLAAVVTGICRPVYQVFCRRLKPHLASLVT